MPFFAELRQKVAFALNRILPRQCASGIFSVANYLCCCGKWGSLDEALGGPNAGGELLRVLVLGLDQSGKTALLSRLSKVSMMPAGSSEYAEYVPTAGYQVSTISRDGHHIEFWEIGGGDDFRSLWVTQTPEKHAVLFVMSRDRQEEASEALRIFRHHAPDLPVVAVFVVGQQDDKLCVELDRDIEVVPCTLSSPQSMCLVWRTVVDAARV